MSSNPASPFAPITRREALRRTVLFSTAALAAGTRGFLRAAPAVTKFPDDGMHLLALGDYGTKGDASQTAVANAMAEFARSLSKPLEAVLALGDNFYGKIKPGRFQTDFEDLYSLHGLSCPFYACAGNHDYGTADYDPQKGKLQIQLDYAKQHPESRWKFPAKWYSIELPHADEPLVKVIVLDGNDWPGALTPQEKIAQRRWLEDELKKKSNAPWLWVVNHFPLFSDSVHGDTPSLIREWGKMLNDKNVALCLAGHDHTMQHLRVESFKPSFVVAGAGGQKLYDVKQSDRGYADGKHLGFSHIHVTPEKLNVQLITADGDCLHHFERTPAGDVKVLV